MSCMPDTGHQDSSSRRAKANKRIVKDSLIYELAQFRWDSQESWSHGSDIDHHE